jgi:class 3 adenylate cyclase/tetratricopeptide (TPR) repeat protein
MQCSRCHYEAPDDAEFCPDCGIKLELICSGCGAGNATLHKFCKKCGRPLGRITPGRGLPAKFLLPASYTPKYLAEKIVTSGPGLEAERKQVTVLFADIKGSLELLLGRDPEDARRLLDAVLELMVDAVHRYEGTISHFMGDGVMALFGAPVAHEDHAIRACYAALMMQECITRHSQEVWRTEGIRVQVRVGLNSGEVLVRAVRSDLQMDYTAIGQTVHLAARMEQIATPGSILAARDLARLVDGYLELRPLGAVPIKGLTTSVDVYEVIGVGIIRSRLQAAAARGLTHFVGRNPEMRMLQQSLELAASGRGQVVAVMGEAGVGKSRLLYELTHSDCTDDWLVLESNSSSYGRATSYLPVIDFLKDYFKINPRDDLQTIREKVTGRVVTLDQSLLESIAPLLDLLEALPQDHSFHALDPTQRRQQTVQTFKRLMLRESRIQPVVLVFEDLHWSDSLSLSLLEGLVDGLPDERVLLLLTYRPDYQDDWTARPHYRRIRLDPLPRDGIEQLLTALLGADPSLSGVKRFLMDRAEGNPFFLEEIVQTLIETGVLSGHRGKFRSTKPISTTQVPPQVQAVIASRIDRLPPERKRLLQEASVIGKDVPFALLRALNSQSEQELRGGVADLLAAEFLYETELFPDFEYTFKHALTLKVTYEGLTKDRRQEIHARVVDVIEKLHADRITEQVERLAHHAFHGQVWPKALVYLREAGAKSVERRANREAVLLFQQALHVLKHLPEDRDRLEQAVDIRFDIRNALQPLGDLSQILEYLREAESLAVRLNDQRRLGWVSAYLTEQFRMLGDPDSAAKAGERALAIGQSLADVQMQVVTNLPMGLLYHAIGDYRRAVKFFQWNVDQLGSDLAYERFGLFGLPSVFSRAFLAYCFAELGEFSRGDLIGEEGIRIAIAAEHPFSQVYAYLGAGYLHLRKGDFHRAIAALERALALGQLSQIPVAFAYGASYLGYALTLVGRVDEALPLLERTTEESISTRFVARHSLRLAYLGEAYHLAGRIDDAAATARRALRLAREHRERGHEAYALRLLGEVCRGDNAADAEMHYRDALLIAKELGMRPLEALCHSGLARLMRGTAMRTQLRQHAAAATALFREMNMTTSVSQLEAELEGTAEELVVSSTIA